MISTLTIPKAEYEPAKPWFEVIRYWNVKGRAIDIWMGRRCIRWEEAE